LSSNVRSKKHLGFLIGLKCLGYYSIVNYSLQTISYFLSVILEVKKQ
jgi:hypothetical protein